MVMGFHEDVIYCSAGTSSGKQKKNRSASQPQFRSPNTPRTIETGQVSLAFQQLLANNTNSAIFNTNVRRISNLQKFLVTTMSTFDGKSERFQLFKDIFQTILKIYNQLTEDEKIKYFLSLMKGDALLTVINRNSPTRENSGEILAVFRRKYVKSLSIATAKHKFQKLVFNPANQKLIRFLDEFQNLAKDAFRIAAHAVIEQFKYGKIQLHLKKSKFGPISKMAQLNKLLQTLKRK